ncbi:MAG TPA: hypothetical protein VEK06_03800, partial [Myxococcota bacterium]|nr:hypothetical protein [Myxococcota bacterium]
GQGLKAYVAILEAFGNELKLFNVSDSKLEAEHQLTHHPEALYFPDQKSDPCCGGEKQWLASMGTGHLTYIAVKEEGGKLGFKELSSTDLKSEKNLSLSQLTVEKILGGTVIYDPALKREKTCQNNRKMFYISSYARDKPDIEYFVQSIGGYEVEAQAQSCEGEQSASRLGTIEAERPRQKPVNIER